MNLDFKTVRALSSPTRVEILSHSLQNEATPTNTADKIGKSKSTVSSHLEKLVKAGLLEKDQEPGRKRVIYQPTKKAEAIVNGRERKVKFSITSSAITAFTGLAFLYPLTGGLSTVDDAEANIMMESADAAPEAAEPGLQTALAEPFLFISAGFILVSLTALSYGLVLRELDST